MIIICSSGTRFPFIFHLKILGLSVSGLLRQLKLILGVADQRAHAT